MNWNLFIDDERMPPRDERTWKIARNLDEAKKLIEAHGAPSFISFDHDLGEDTPTGFDIAKLIVEMDMDGEISLPEAFDFYVHSQNPVGRDNIEHYLRNYLRISRS